MAMIRKILTLGVATAAPLIVACSDAEPTTALVSAVDARASVKSPTVEFTIVDLGTFGTGFAQAYGINERGDVIGRYGVGLAQRSFRWTKRDGKTDLGDVGGAAFAVLKQNNEGTLTGWISGPSAPIATVWTPSGGFQVIGDASVGGSQAWGVNEPGQVVGYRRPFGGATQSAFLWSKTEGMLEMPPLAGPRSSAGDINNLGQVVGTTTISTACCAQRGFLWERDAGMEILPTLGGNTFPLALNQAGDVVGHSDVRQLLPRERQSSGGVPGACPTHAFLWRRGTGIIDLGTLGGANSMAWAVDKFGNAYGWSENAAGNRRAFRWSPQTGMIDLGTLGGLSAATGGVDNRGIVAGQATDATGVSHAVLFVPSR
jgi:probable HAF family extracellular repeat protein